MSNGNTSNGNGPDAARCLFEALAVILSRHGDKIASVDVVDSDAVNKHRGISEYMRECYIITFRQLLPENVERGQVYVFSKRELLDAPDPLSIVAVIELSLDLTFDLF